MEATAVEDHPIRESSDGGAPPQPHTLSRVVAFMNQKGGVGKTTSVVNLAAAIAQAGRSVLLVDLDPQAHATLHLGLDPSALERSVYDVLLEPAERVRPLSEEETPAVVGVRERLALLPAVTDLAAAEQELADEPDRIARLSRFLECVKHRYEFIFFDCPPSLGMLTLNGLAAAKEVVMPMQAHFLALQGVGKLLETVQLVGQQVNPSLRVSGVVLCMHDEQTRHSKEVVGDIEAFFKASAEQDVPWRGARVYRPAVRRNIKLAEAPSFGESIFEYAPGCPGAKDYEAVAASFVREWDRLIERRAAPRAEAAVEPKPSSPEPAV